MELTEKQLEGLKIIVSRYKAREKYTTIAGYAGTGKSTLIKFAIAALGVDEKSVAYATYTGKAAEVLRKKGNPNAKTLHKLLYLSSPKPNGGFYRKPVKALECSIIIVDEVSMVPQSMIELLLSYGIHTIFLGDPFQLPPVSKEDTNNLLSSPHIFLTEIMRQAAESEIIQLTMKIRAGEKIDNFNGKEVKVISKKELNSGMLTWADQILVATNKTRHAVNRQMRSIYGYEGIVQPGEKIICKRNYWDTINENGEPIVNGSVGILTEPMESKVYLPSVVDPSRKELKTIKANFIPDGEKPFRNLEIDRRFLIDEEVCVDYKTAYKVNKTKTLTGFELPYQMTYGYAITVHAAQGSQWENVLVIEEKFPFKADEHARWLYTACTRPEQKLILVRP